MHDLVSVLVIMYMVYSTYNCIYIYNGCFFSSSYHPPTPTRTHMEGVGVGGYQFFFARRGTHIGSTSYPHTKFLKEYLQTYTPYTYPSKALTCDYSDFNIKVNKLYLNTYQISKNIEKIFYKRDFPKQKISSKKLTKTPLGEEKTGGLLFI